MPYDSIDWNAARSQIAKEDLYYPHPIIQVGRCACFSLHGACMGLCLRLRRAPTANQRGGGCLARPMGAGNVSWQPRQPSNTCLLSGWPGAAWGGHMD